MKRHNILSIVILTVFLIFTNLSFAHNLRLHSNHYKIYAAGILAEIPLKEAQKIESYTLSCVDDDCHSLPIKITTPDEINHHDQYDYPVKIACVDDDC